MIEHNRLNLLFERIRQLISIPAKYFDAIKFTRIDVYKRQLEPLAYCLEGSCSIQLSYWRMQLERVMGIEPTRPAWKAGVLPLNYTRILRRK